MLRNVSILTKSIIIATEGEIGHVEDVYFDEQAWAIRYLVVDTGTWLESRNVLISPYSVTHPLASNGVINVSLTREQVRNSPDIDTHKPVSRQQESEYLGFYGYPTYWIDGGLWPMGGLPTMPPTVLPDYAERHEHRETNVNPDDVYLRSIDTVNGYYIEASDGTIGHIDDFIFDDGSWAIRYFVIDTRNWWPGSKKVLIATHWIDRIDWVERKAFTTLTRDSIKNSPPYDESAVLNRDYEVRLHGTQGRAGYWE